MSFDPRPFDAERCSMLASELANLLAHYKATRNEGIVAIAFLLLGEVDGDKSKFAESLRDITITGWVTHYTEVDDETQKAMNEMQGQTKQ